MKRNVILIIAFLLNSTAYTQKQDLKSKLYKLEDNIIAGDIGALREIIKYLDDKTFVQEFLGHHNYPNTARGVAKRIIEENCLFTEDEFRFDSKITSAKFANLINSGKVNFDDITGMYLITKISNRNTKYELKKITGYESQRLDTVIGRTAYPAWYYENQIDGFLVTKNPEALMWVASARFQKRSRFNRYYFNDEEFTDLMKKLTMIDLGVPDERGTITFLLENDYYAKARLNYLIYWATHYNDYKWNDDLGYFENIKEKIGEKSKEETLFELLNSESDSLALDAFAQLAELDTGKIRVLAVDYEKNRADRNYALPTFPFRFLKQMSLLTQYCRNNAISYKAEGWLLDSLNKLKGWPDFPVKYRLENDLIDRLTADNITQTEYFGLLYENEWSLTYSIGRIVDKFYSLKWKEIITDDKHLLLFLKKARLFDEIGIVGNVNKYLRKFENCSQDVISKLKHVFNTTTDSDIRASAGAAIYQFEHKAQNDKEKYIPKIKVAKYGVPDLRNEYLAIVKKYKKKEDRVWPLKQLFAKINYSQLSEAIKILRADTNYGQYDDKYWILKNDFGIEIESYDKSDIEEFIRLHKTRSEFELYKHYFLKKGLGCLDHNGNFIFERVYDVLKYDVVDAFAGGGGSRREKGVYELIKLLELKFGTRLGFPEKLCESEGVYSCHCDDRASAWMKFLSENKIAVPDESEPPSIAND